MTTKEESSDCLPSPHLNDLASRVLDSLAASVAVIDRHGTIIATNEAWRTFSSENGGKPASTGCGINYLTVCDAAKGDDHLYAERARHGIKGILDNSRESFTLEYPCHSPTSNRWFLLHASPLKGDAKYAVITHVSITERKLLENQLVESARLAAIGQAMKGLSHRGRNSLQHAQGFIDLLRSQVEHDVEALKLLDRVEIAQRRLISLYEEVQHYAEPIYLHCSRRRVDEIAADSWQSLFPTSREFRFSQMPSQFDLTCEVDPSAIGQVFRFVMDNAMSTAPLASCIDIRYVQDEIDGRPAITILISDDGPGISVDDRKKVFEAFYTTGIASTGLGLATCRRIVEAHGGRIVIADPICGGTTVAMTLPVTQPTTHRIPNHCPSDGTVI